MLNRGTAFTPAEREALGLTGLLPEGVSTIEGQLARVYGQYRRQPDDLAKNLYLANLRDRNEVLFYRLLTEHIAEMLPIVYTPTIGTAIERYSLEYGRPRGVYLSVDHPDQVETAFRNYGLGPDDVDLIVATDSEGILGIGDWGVGGIAIAIGKLAVYVAAAGLHPRRVIPVVLDAGTDNQALLDDPMYLGNRHPRVRGERYDELIDAYVSTATRLFPNAMLHWEDFGAANARRILTKYAEHLLHLQRRHAGHRRRGAGRRAERGPRRGDADAGPDGGDPRRGHRGDRDRGRAAAGDDRRRPAPRRGHQPVLRAGPQGPAHQRLRRDDAGFPGPVRPPGRRSRQLAARRRRAVSAWPRSWPAARPTMLIGTSTQPGVFSEPIVTEMAAHTARPVIMPLSNPTSHSEARPADLIAWTGGRALIATGSPFPPVTYDGVRYQIAQANNALIFPGLGLGVTVSRARRVSDGMLAAAADALAGLSGAAAPGAPLLAEQPHAGRGGAGQGLLYRLGMALDVQARADADAGELAEQHGVMRRRRVLGQHRVQRLPGPERVCRHLGGRVHVAALGHHGLWPRPQAQRGEPVPRLQGPHGGHVGGAVDERAAQREGPRCRRGRHRLDPGRQVSPPAGPADSEMPGLGPGRALPDVGRSCRN